MSRHCTSGRPASIMVANWRVKITSSRVLIPGFRNGRYSLTSFGFDFTLTGSSICARSWAITAASFPASSSPFLMVPCRVRAFHK
jgi:hypothetical protein